MVSGAVVLEHPPAVAMLEAEIHLQAPEVRWARVAPAPFITMNAESLGNPPARYLPELSLCFPYRGKEDESEYEAEHKPLHSDVGMRPDKLSA
jgi:hypothetical protein